MANQFTENTMMQQVLDKIEELGIDKVADDIANARSISELGRTYGVPYYAFGCWVEDHAVELSRAKKLRAAKMADEAIEIADDGFNDGYADERSGIVKLDYENIQRSKLRVDTRRWLASKLDSKSFGDKVQQEITGKDGTPLIDKPDLSKLSAAEIEALISMQDRIAT